MICFICGLNFGNWKALVCHFKIFHSLKSLSTYRCGEGNCKQSFQSLATFKRHIHAKHFPELQLNFQIPEQPCTNSSLPSLNAETINKNNLLTENENAEIPFNFELVSELLYKSAVELVVNLHSNNNFSRVDIVNIQVGIVEKILTPIVSMLKKVVGDEIKEPILLSKFHRVASVIENTFLYCSTEYRLLDWLINNEFLSKINQFTINNEICPVQHIGETIFDEKNTTGALLPLKFQFKKYFEQGILEYFKTHNKLNDGIRATLVDILIAQVLSQQIPMSVSLAESLANQIVAMFKTEVKDTYFMKIGCNKNPKGKLYSKYYNSVRNMKNTGLIPTTIIKNKIINDKTQKNGWFEKEFVSESEIDSILDVLKYNDTTFPELESNWKATVNYRLNDIKNSGSTTDILKNWKQYKVPYGHKLIDIDYNVLFPTNINIYQDFKDKSDKIFKLFDEKIKDLNSRKILDTLKNTNEMNINDNVNNCVLVYLLHALFAPTSRKLTRDEQGKKNLIKYSIKDSQDSFIVFGESVDVMQQHLEQLKSRGDPIQPFILIVGTIFHPKEILVYFDTIMYKVHSILRSIEVCYKIFHLFNLEYPSQSSIVWLFVQKYFFGVTSPYDSPHPKLVQILSELKN
ncbi:uncharacterized protein LOC107883741 [Acyrthosiphon pisum]|uniref:C2H2-type domain-containing protein n=1 Tax=Acyrthosiphon pisum TaxID=7029 RepID=A0A8R2H7Y0_ACYPI|nr:uncharacterized protein LOC107883741 [Acyrthosiphon pisum]|eukprot:XP_016659852.1 PREDICTED: uncharacterized protein LOC107883741 [Acyrthosiphon pisum]